jgi:hypothetical protein
VSQEWQVAYLREVERVIGEHGWAVQGVFATPTTPSHSYTIGLARRFGHPELAFEGLPGDVAQTLLNDVALRVERGKVVEHGAVFTDLATMAVRAVRVEQGLEFGIESGRFPIAWQVEAKELAAHGVIQLVYPDPEGRFPWDDGYDMAAQTLWGTAPAGSA